MFKPVCLFFSLLVFSTHSVAFEPELQQQGMFYLNVSFDAGNNTRTKHHFGFRIDHGLVKPGETMMLSELAKKPAALDIQYTRQGMQAFNIHGVNYLQEILVSRGAEAGAEEEPVAEPEATPADTSVEAGPVEETSTAEATPRRELNIPFGVVLGLGIGLIAIAGSGS